MKGLKIGLWMLLGVGVGYGGYQLYMHLYGPITDKNTAIDVLVKANPTRDAAKLQGFGTDQLLAWATAVRKKQPTFSVAGKNFSTASGTAI